MSTSVIIPHHTKNRDLSVLRSVLDSVLSQPGHKDLEVIVVCNPPSAQELELRALYNKSITVLSTPEANVNRARNMGLKAAHGDTVLFLDDDCILDDHHCLEKILKRFNDDSELAAFGGDVRIPESAGRWDKAYFDVQHKWIRRARQPDQTNSYLFGGFLAARASELKTIDFDEKISFGGAEIGMLGHLRSRNKKIQWTPDLTVLHKSHLNFRQFVTRAFKQGRNVGNLPRPSSAPVCYAEDALHRPTIAEEIYSLFYSLGKTWGGFRRWQISEYAQIIRSFVRNSAHTLPITQRLLQLRTLSRVNRALKE
jgi:glycosyltransferase involved in cell wall biosynthesis